MRRSVPLITFTLLILAVSGLFAAPNGGSDASWSPDGKLIAFSSGLPHGITNIWVIRPDGTNPVQLTTRGGRNPKWIPGTHTIYFVTGRAGKEQILSIDATAQPGTEKPHPALPADAFAAQWSPDGKRVAYLVPAGRSRDLWVADADGSNRKGVSMNFFIREFCWTPDSKKVAFIVGRSIGSSIWLADAETKDTDIIYKGFCSALTYSPDGKFLAFAAPAAKGSHKLVALDLATGIDKRIMAESFDGSAICWLPDQRGFLFTSNWKTDIGIWSVDMEGKTRKPITDPKMAAYEPVFSPDGKRLLFSATTQDSYGLDLYVSDAGGANARRLTSTQSSQWAPVWSHNGSKLAVASDSGYMGRVFVVDPRSGKANNPAQIDPSASIKLLWSKNDSKLLIVQGKVISAVPSTAGKPSSKTVTSASSDTDACWSADSTGIYFTQWKDTLAGTSFVSLDGKDKRQVTVGVRQETEAKKVTDQHTEAHKAMGMAGPVEETSSSVIDISDLCPRLSPDGKLIAYIRDNQIWTAEENGRSQRQLTQLSAPKDDGPKSDISSLEWSSDGKLLLFQRHVNDDAAGLEFQIWTVEADSGEANKVYTEKVDTEYGIYAPGITYAPTFTPDGKSILFTSTVSGGSEIATVDLTGGNRKVLVKGPAVFPVFAPNGTMLAYISLEDSKERLKVLNLATGETKDVRLPG